MQDSDPPIDPSGTGSGAHEPAPSDRPLSDESSSAQESDMVPESNSEQDGVGNGEGDLPEWVPLSPEILEDEAIRGDFVLRWAVVALAFLAACTEIYDARTLVHVRMGQWWAPSDAHPRGLDPYSIAGADRPWVNLSWLFDGFSAALHAAGGPALLSIMQGLAAVGVLIAVASAARLGIRTWWGSLCGALLILTAYPQWEWRPELVTLLGIALLLAFLVRREEPDRPAPPLWWIPAGLWFWAQLDAHAWIGWLILALYTLGCWLFSTHVSVTTRESPAQLARITALSAGALLIHPHLWQTWLAPWSQYMVEYPALRAAYPRPMAADVVWYPLTSPQVWRHIDPQITAGLLLMAAAVITLVLNRSRVRASHVLCVVGVNLLAILTLHELPVAAVVNALIATVNAQEWYRARFGQVYSIAWNEVLFSRGGRALTVAGLFVMAWVLISGRLEETHRYRTGVGLARSLQHEMEDLRQLHDTVPDDLAFHFTLRQGDALIAAGRRSFVDHRVAIFAAPGRPNLLALHDRARRTLRHSTNVEPGEEQVRIQKAAFDDFKISHVLTRLSDTPAPADYETFKDLASSGRWGLTRILPTCGVFLRQDAADPAQRTYANSHALNVVTTAFRETDPQPSEPHQRMIPPPWTQKWISLPDNTTAAGTLESEHWQLVALLSSNAPLPFQLGTALLAVRSGQEGVQERPELARSHRALALAYAQLLRVEGAALAESGIVWTQSLRFYQAISAARQAALLDPEDPQTHMLTMELHQGAGHLDATHAALQAYLDLTADQEMHSPEEFDRREAIEKLRDQLGTAVNEANGRVDDALAQSHERVGVAQLASQLGLLQRAVALLQEDAVYVERTPPARLLLSEWLAELGEGLDLDDSVASLSRIGDASGMADWRDPVAYATLGVADYQGAIDQWTAMRTDIQSNRLQALLFTTPLATTAPVFLGDARYPISRLMAIQEVGQRQENRLALTSWKLAMCELERGDLAATKKGVQQALEQAPASEIRPLLRLYWYCLTDELLDAEPPQDWIPVDSETFTPETPTEKQ